MSIGGRSGYGSFFRSLLSPGFLNFPWQGENPETNATASLLQNRFRPLHYFAADRYDFNKK
ncbi:hypothetical protein [Paenibacillus illinoisensis]|uniref:hypothetical protein n=1 Tax=Paenibacillus illinoisensis TaxID=59845 RepID=UPI003019086F